MPWIYGKWKWRESNFEKSIWHWFWYTGLMYTYTVYHMQIRHESFRACLSFRIQMNKKKTTWSETWIHWWMWSKKNILPLRHSMYKNHFKGVKELLLLNAFFHHLSRQTIWRSIFGVKIPAWVIQSIQRMFPKKIRIKITTSWQTLHSTLIRNDPRRIILYWFGGINPGR